MERDTRMINLLDAFLVVSIVALLCMMFIQIAPISKAPMVRIGGDMTFEDNSTFSVRP